MSYFDDISEEQKEWYRLLPHERWEISQQLWLNYFDLGGSLDPEPDTQSPFFDSRAPIENPTNGGAGLHIIRRSGV